MERITPDDFHELSTVGDPRLSPDGSTVAYVRRKPFDDREYRTTVETVPVDGGEPRTFTAGEWSASQPRWSPSGDRLAFVSARSEEGRPQLWVMPADGGEARCVTNVPGGVADVTWSPDGEAVAFLQETTAEEREGADVDVPEEYEPGDEGLDPYVLDRLVYRMESAYRTARTWEQYFGGTRTHVYVADLETDEVERVTDGDVDHVGLSWAESGLHYLRRVGDDDSVVYDVRRWAPATGEIDTVTRTFVHPGLTMQTVAAADDGRVAYPTDRSTEKRMSQTDVAVYDPGTDEETLLTDGLDRKAGFAPLLAWDSDEEFVYYTVPDEGETVVYRSDGDGSGEPERVFAGTDVSGVDLGGRTLAVTQSEWDHPGDVFAASLDESGVATETTRLTTVNEEYLASREVCEPEEIRFATEDGPEVQGWVLTPPDFDPDESYPLVVEVHGGPIVMWTTSGTMWHEFQTLANAGYVVFWSNPRGSIGYGEAFTRAVERDWGGPYYHDLMAGVDAVVERDYVDEDNVFITGGSYGGYMTAWAIGQTDRFRAANPQRGVYDIKTMYGTSSVANLLEYMYAGLMPWDDPDRYWEHSPIAHVESVDTPTLIFQSETDYNTPAADSEMYYRFLKKQDVPTRMIYYPRDGHELSRSGEPAHAVDRLERIVGWFDGYSDFSDADPPLPGRETADAESGERQR
jgi:dipeptidyl aminopeptidase/acylaminoacyl peptidase